MARIFTISIFLILSYTVKAQYINIPDANFKRALVENISININGDKEISKSEAASITFYLDVRDRQIKDLTGIEYFTNIERLYCSYNDIRILNLRKNKKLVQLDCSNNQLVKLDVSNNLKLASLQCSNNNLISLDINKNTEIHTLYCYSNQLTSLDVSKNSKLAYLNCINNSILFSHLYELSTVFSNLYYYSYNKMFAPINKQQNSLIDYSSEVQINGTKTSFTWYNDNSNEVDEEYVKEVNKGVFKFLKEGTFYCKMTNEEFPHLILKTHKITIYNSNIIDIPDANFKKALINNSQINRDGNSKITEFEAGTTIGVLNISNKEITDLTGIEYFTNITSLICSQNQLERLNINSNKKLVKLDCSNNKLENLYIRENIELYDLNCSYNQLSNFVLSKDNKQLVKLNIDQNQVPFSILNKIKNINPELIDTKINSLDSIRQINVFNEVRGKLGYEIDFSDESEFNGSETTYTWLKNGKHYDINELEISQLKNGIFKFLESGTYHCKMTNKEFPNFVITTSAIKINQKQQDIVIDYIPNQVNVNDVVDITAKASSGLEVHFDVISGDASIVENTVKFNKAGTVEIKATQAGNDEFEACEKIIEVQVEKRIQSVEFANVPASMKVNDEIELNATASSGLDVNFELVSGQASMNGNELIFIKSGIVKVKAVQIGNDEYKASEAIIEITVSRKTQTIDFANTPEKVKINDVIELDAASSSGLDVNFELIEGNIDLIGNSIQFNQAGRVEIKAIQAGNDEYAAAEKSIEIQVEKRAQSIEFVNTPEIVKVNDTVELEATSSSGLDVSFKLVEGNADIIENSIQFNQAGRVEIKAIQEGNDEYEACEKTIEITVDFATGIEDVLESSTQIYPNPVVSEMAIKFADNEDRTIRIFNLQGQLKLQKETSSNTERLNLSDFKSGMYLMRVQSVDETFTYKIIKK